MTAPYLEEYREDYNRRFSRHPRSSHDAHRRLRETERLEEIFTLQERRRVTEELTLHYKRAVCVIEDREENRNLRGARAMVHEHEDGTVTIRHHGRALRYHVHLKDEARVTQASNRRARAAESGVSLECGAAETAGCRASGQPQGDAQDQAAYAGNACRIRPLAFARWDISCLCRHRIAFE